MGGEENLGLCRLIGGFLCPEKLYKAIIFEVFLKLFDNC
jgi:hypothetical protein